MAKISVSLPGEYDQFAISNLFEELFYNRDLNETVNANNILSFQTNGTTQVTVPHGLDHIPTGWIIIYKDAISDIYDSAAADSTNFYFKSSTTGTNFKIMAF